MGGVLVRWTRRFVVLVGALSLVCTLAAGLAIWLGAEPRRAFEIVFLLVGGLTVGGNLLSGRRGMAAAYVGPEEREESARLTLELIPVGVTVAAIGLGIAYLL